MTDVSRKSLESMEPKVKVRCFRNGPTSGISDPLRWWPVRITRDDYDECSIRDMKGHSTHVAVRAARYSSFDPDRWWETRGGIRTEIIELQKLLLDVVLHPLSF